MSDPSKPLDTSARSSAETATSGNPLPLPTGPLAKRPWLTFLLPFIVYMVVGTLEPVPGEGGAGGAWLGLDIAYEHYPIVYSLRITLTLLTMAYVLPGYQTFPFRVGPWAIVVGVLGVVAWVGICRLHLEAGLLEVLRPDWLIEAIGPDWSRALGLKTMFEMGQRSAFNPLEHLADRPVWAYGFLVIRFVGLALVVPVIEEFFLRGFLMRFLVADRWWQVPFGKVNRAAVIAGTAVPMLMHPGELLAALVWFSAVTWLMVRTRNIWDCVAAHAVTNFLLGVYVVSTGHWELM